MASETQTIDIDCISANTCRDLNICSDGEVNIDCLGGNTCFDGMFCDDILSLNRNCTGSNSCQN